jgi:Tfp pilus assembly protein PilV
LQQAGDTIVEVLVAVAVVSAVLAGAYATTNRNVLTIQDTQEHAQALQLVQSQIEFLRKNPIDSGTYSCYTSVGDPAVGTAAPTSDPCTVNGEGVHLASVPQPAYKIVISGSGATVYKVDITWPSVHNDKAEVSMYYRP